MFVIAGGNDGELIWTIKYSDNKDCSELVKGHGQEVVKFLKITNS